MRLWNRALKIHLGNVGRGRTIEFRVLGPVQALADGEALRLGAPKQRAVLAELLLARGAVVPRTDIVDAVWGEEAPDSALASLQVYVHGLRKELGADRIETHGNGYRLPLEPDELDAERFDRLVERARAALDAGRPLAAAEDLRAALGLWRGSALADLAEHPVARRAGALEARRVHALELRNDAELELGRHAELLGELAALVEAEPYRERFREQQVLALYRAGHQKEALEAYREARRVLVDELGVDPGPGLRELERAVLRQDPALDAPARPAAPRLQLPVPPTPLVGRRLETAAAAALLRRDDVRLVTLTGAGGTGKTRLALAVAEELAPELAGGAAFVDLAPVSDAESIPSLVVQALSAGGADGDPVAAVAERVGDLPLLLVLDNLEQLLPEVEPVARLLAAAPRLLVLATSRAPLRLSGEHEYPVPPLPVPEAGASFEESAANESVRLFVARARAVSVGFELNDANVSAVGSVCRRLDGLPLALELAAARVRVLAPDEIERRLGSALDLLVEGARDLPPRQRTLRATLDWSFALLDEGERATLAGLSVFAGGCTLEAAQEVLGDAGVLDRVSTLAENSLLAVTSTGAAARLTLLETIREYALEQLRASGREAEVRRRHAEVFVELAERGAEDGSAGATEACLAVFDREHENLLGALAWSAEQADVEVQVRLAVALRFYWQVRGYIAEGVRLFESVLAVSAGAAPKLRAKALIHAGFFAFRSGDLHKAQAEWEEALALFRELGDDEETARCTAELGAVAWAAGRLDEAAALYRECSVEFAAQGRRMREALALSNLAAIAADRGDHETAEADGERVVEIQRDLADLDSLGISLHNLAGVKLALGRVDEARALAVESVEIADRLGYRELLAYALGNIAELAEAGGDAERAARLLGGSDVLFAELGVVRTPGEAERRARLGELLQTGLGEPRFRDLSAAGAASSVEDLVAEAVALVPSAARPR
jgi:predicted ATPase/DNA-binding SARP family transcriptional activator